MIRFKRLSGEILKGELPYQFLEIKHSSLYGAEVAGKLTFRTFENVLEHLRKGKWLIAGTEPSPRCGEDGYQNCVFCHKPISGSIGAMVLSYLCISEPPAEFMAETSTYQAHLDCADRHDLTLVDIGYRMSDEWRSSPGGFW